MKNEVMLACVDDAGAAFAKGKLEQDCVFCGKALFLTRKQFDAYKQHAGKKRLMFQCSSCFASKVIKKRLRDEAERN